MSGAVRQWFEVPNSGNTSESSCAGAFGNMALAGGGTRGATLAGSTIVVQPYYSYNISSAGTLTDAQSNDYQQLEWKADPTSSGNQWLMLFVAEDATVLGANDLITFSDAGTYFTGFIAIEVTGVLSSSLISHNSNYQTGLTGTATNNLNSGNLACGTGATLLMGFSVKTTKDAAASYPASTLICDNEGSAGSQLPGGIASNSTTNVVAGAPMVCLTTVATYAGQHASRGLQSTNGDSFVNKTFIQGPADASGGYPYINASQENDLWLCASPTAGATTFQQWFGPDGYGGSNPGDQDYQAFLAFQYSAGSTFLGYGAWTAQTGTNYAGVAQGTALISGSITLTSGQVPCRLYGFCTNTSGLGSNYNATPNSVAGVPGTTIENTWAFGSGTDTSCYAYWDITTAGTYAASFDQPSTTLNCYQTVCWAIQGPGASPPFAPTMQSGYTLGGNYFTNGGYPLGTWEYLNASDYGTNPAYFNTPSTAANDSFITLGLVLAVGTASGAALAGAASDVTTASANLSTAINLLAAAADATAAIGALTNYASVTLVAPLYVGVGGLLDPNNWLDNSPVAGDTIYYDPTYLTIEPDAELVGTSNNFTAFAWFNDGSGPATDLITFTPDMVGYADDLTIAAADLTTGAASAQLAGAAQTLTNASAALSTQITLIAQAVDAFSAASGLSAQILLDGSAADSTQAAASLTTPGKQLAGVATDTTSALGALTTAIRLAAQAVDTTSASALVRGSSAALSGLATDSTAAQAVLTAKINLQAAANDITSAAAFLTTQARLAGIALDTASANASLAPQHAGLAGSASDVTLATGHLLTAILLAGVASDVTASVVSLFGAIQMYALAASASSAAATLGSNITLRIPRNVIHT